MIEDIVQLMKGGTFKTGNIKNGTCFFTCKKKDCNFKLKVVETNEGNNTYMTAQCLEEHQVLFFVLIFCLHLLF